MVMHGIYTLGSPDEYLKLVKGAANNMTSNGSLTSQVVCVLHFRTAKDTLVIVV